MFSSALYKAGVLAAPAYTQQRVVKSLNRRAKRYLMAHPDALLMAEREMHRRIERRLLDFKEGR